MSYRLYYKVFVILREKSTLVRGKNMYYLTCTHCYDTFETDNEDTVAYGWCNCGGDLMQISKAEFDQDYEDNVAYFEDIPEYRCDLSGNVILCQCEDYPCCGH